jgi:hypothetical protein
MQERRLAVRVSRRVEAKTNADAAALGLDRPHKREVCPRCGDACSGPARRAISPLFEARRLRELESENAKLKRLLADTMLDNVALTRRAA